MNKYIKILCLIWFSTLNIFAFCVFVYGMQRGGFVEFHLNDFGEMYIEGFIVIVMFFISIWYYAAEINKLRQ